MIKPLSAHPGFTFSGIGQLQGITSPATTLQVGIAAVEITVVQQILAEGEAAAQPETLDSPEASPSPGSMDEDAGLQDQSFAAEGQEGGELNTTPPPDRSTPESVSALPPGFSQPPSTTGTPDRSRCAGEMCFRGRACPTCVQCCGIIAWPKQVSAGGSVLERVCTHEHWEVSLHPVWAE